MRLMLSVLAAASLLNFTSVHAQPQKLKDVQEVSVLPPEDLKVDGKNKEWGGKFLAQNKRTGTFYTISNDDKYLYFAFKGKDITENPRFVAGGITISINKEGSKKEKESCTITYPYFPEMNNRNFTALIFKQDKSPKSGAAISAKQTDSIVSSNLRKQLLKAKEIRIDRFRQTTDTVISIYNAYGIKAYCSIEGSESFFYELAIPLAQLGIMEGALTELSYNVRVNGLPSVSSFNYTPGRQMNGGLAPGPTIMISSSSTVTTDAGTFRLDNLSVPADFWGKYTLIKK